MTKADPSNPQFFLYNLRPTPLRKVLPVKPFCTFMTLVVVAVMLTACDDIYSVLWSPDGARVAVLTDNGLRLGDATGSLSKEIPIKPKLFRWLPDSTHAVWVTEKPNASWVELKQFLSQKQQVRVGRIANIFWNYRGDPNKWKPGDDLLAYYVFPYLEANRGHQAYTEMLRKRLKVTDLHGLFNVYSLRLFTVQNDTIKPGPILLRTDKEIEDIRISPKGKYVAVSEDLGNDCHRLTVVSVDGQQRSIVDTCTGEHADWSADGRNLFYISANKKHTSSQRLDEMISLGSLLCQRITDVDGKLLPHFGTPMKLCQLEFSQTDRIRCLPDGSIIFSGQAVQLPCVQQEFQKRDALFKLSPDFSSLKPIIFSRGPSDYLNYFEINQDGTRAVIARTYGEVTVLNLSNGDAKTLESDGPKAIKFMPQWRSAEELCFPHRVTNKKPGDPDVEVVLASVSEDKKQVLSKTWPVKSIGFLYDTQESSPKKPTTGSRTRAR
jgi:hypothetical protein